MNHPIPKNKYHEFLLTLLIEHFSLKENENEHQNEQDESRISHESFTEDSMSTSL